MRKLLLLLCVLLGMQAMRAEIRDTIVVARDGTGQYRNIAEALEACRAFMDYEMLIYVKAGTYKEKLIVPAWLENIIIEGEDVGRTVITYDDHANIDHMGTFRTYTVRVDGNGITFRNITIENNAPQMGQAVALHTEGDRLTFINCRILGNQDTVYTGGPRTRLYFHGCYIEGTTDYIFGPSTAWFEACTLHCKRNSYLTAASTPEGVDIGYVFNHCRITYSDDVSKMYLGRPWRDHAYTLFMHCDLGDKIRPEGWHNWKRPECEATVRYFEYANTGVSATTDKRAAWSRQLTKREAKAVTLERAMAVVPDGWMPNVEP